MNPLERTIVLTGALTVYGAIAALLTIHAEFPLTLIALALPASICFLIPAIHRSDNQSPPVAQLIFETAAPWVGVTAVWAFLRFGDWEFEVVAAGALGFAVMALIVVVVTRLHGAPNVQGQDEISEPTNKA